MIDRAKEDSLWGMACHLSALVGYALPLGNVIGPFVVWMIARDKSEFINQQGKEALNFQITICIAAFIALLLLVVVIGIFLLPVIALVDLVFIIIASATAYQGKPYRYPFTLRLIK